MHSPSRPHQPNNRRGSITVRRRTMAALLTFLAIPALAACGGQTGPVPSSVATASPPASPTPTTEPSLIAIESPATGAAGPVPVLVTGTVATAAGSVTVEAQGEDGTVLCRRSVAAGAGAAGSSREWAASLAFLPPKPATAYAEIPVLVRAYETSAPDANNPAGAITNLVERKIRVSDDLPPIVIAVPACSQTVAAGSPLAVSGRSRAVEALFTLQLRTSDGTVVAEQDVTSGAVSSGSGNAAGAEWTAELALPVGLSSGDYDLVATETVATAAGSTATASPQVQEAAEFAIQLRVE
jgi:hypothetical protein